MPKVKDCMHKITSRVDKVSPDATVEEVITSLAADPVTRAVFVVNEKGTLLGIISAREILGLLGARYLNRRGSVSAREIMATRARDLMGPPYSVGPDDDLEEALRIAVQAEVHDLPVVERGVIVGSIDCLEIIISFPLAETDAPTS